MGEVRAEGFQRQRDLSRLRILHTLLHHPPMSRAELAETLGLSRATVTALVGDLEYAGLISQHPEEGQDRRGSLGRPPLQVSLAADAAFAIGVDFGHRHVRAAVCDLAGGAVASRSAAIAIDEDPRHVLDLAAALTDDALRRAGVPTVKVLGVGVGLAAPIDASSGRIHAAGILERWQDVDVEAELQRRLALPVHVDNDANAGAMGEHLFGAGRGVEHLAYVRLSAGVGLGLILDGRLYRGACGIAGELGHVVAVPDGPLCRCGGRGCLELFASPYAVAGVLERGRREPVGVERLLELVRDGDRGACRAVADAGRAVGETIATTVNLLNPQRVIVGGELAQAGDVLLDPIRDAVTRQSLAPAANATAIVASALGDQAEVLGAAAVQLAHAPHALASRLAELEPAAA